MTRDKDPDLRPGFIRMLMVNTHRMRGRIEELPLEAHTAIIAQNQAGKTSILKLIPFFFGAAPARIQTGRNDNLDFYDFYLPKEDSYIALEYRNAHGAVRSVVVYGSNSGKEPRYRLIRGPLAIDMFREDPEDQTSGFVRRADFERNAIDRGHNLHSRQIDTTRAYRAIIQGLRLNDRGQERSDHRGLVEDYGIGRMSQPLEDIDELFLTTVENSFTVNDLLGTILRKVTQTGSTRIKLLNAEQADLCRAVADNHASYRAVMAVEPTYRAAERADIEQQQNRTEMTRTRAVLMTTVALARERSASMETSIKSEDDRHQQATASSRAIQGDISEKIRSAKKEISDLGRDVTRIRAAREALVGDGAERAADELAAIPALRDRLTSIEAQIAALNGNRDRIDAAFRLELDRLRDQVQEESRRLNARNAEILSEGRDLSEALRREIDDAVGAQAEEQRRREDEFRQSERELTAQIDQLSDDMSAAGPDPELEARRVQAAGYLAEKTTESRAADAALKKSRADHDQADLACRNAEAAQNSAEHRLTGVDAEYDRVSRQLSPAAGSLRKWLEGNRPGWRADIGRVVDERILAMTGLEPELLDPEVDAGLFGIRINTDALPDGCAEIEALETRIAQLNIDRETARVDCAAHRKAHEAAAGKRKTARDQLSKAEMIAQTATDAEERAARSLKDAEAEVTRSVQAKRDALGETRRDLQARRQKVGDEIRSLATTARTANAELRDRMQADQQARKSAQSVAETRIRNEIDALTAREKTERAAIEERRARALSEEGTDPATIAELHRGGEELRALISREGRLHSLLGQWTAFINEEEPRIAKMVARVQAAEFAIPGLEKDLECEKALAVVADQAHQATVTKMRATRARLDSLIGLASQEGLAAEEESDATPRDPEDIPDMIASLRKAGDIDRRLRNEIATAIDALSQTFLGTRGVVKDYFLASKGDGVKLRKDTGHLLRVFAAWFDERHHAIRTSVIEAANVQGAPIIAAYDRIRRIEREINQMGTRIRDAIGALPQFRGVRDIDLRIRSRLSEKPFYADMADFTEAQHRRDLGGSENDVDDLIRAMSSFFRAWEQNSGGGEIDLLNMVYLEGRFIEGGQERKLGRNSDIGSLSSTGGASILRQILLAGLVQLIRGKSDVRFTWGVDELGQLDPNNIRGLVEMLSASGITVVTGSPALSPDLIPLFGHRITIRALHGGQSSTLLSHNEDNTKRSGIRSWTDEGNLIYPEVN